MSKRNLRVANVIKHVLASELLRDEFLVGGSMRSNFVTISEVVVSPDLQNAKIYVRPFQDITEKDMLQVLAEITPFLRKKLSKQLQTKFIPNLHFVADHTVDTALRIDELLKSN